MCFTNFIITRDCVGCAKFDMKVHILDTRFFRFILGTPIKLKKNEQERSK